MLNFKTKKTQGYRGKKYRKYRRKKNPTISADTQKIVQMKKPRGKTKETFAL